MEILSTGLFLFIWKALGTILAVVIGLALIKSGVDSWRNAKMTSGLSKVWSIVDEVVFGLIALAVIGLIFWYNDLGSIITALIKIVQWVWGFIKDILRGLGIPL